MQEVDTKLKAVWVTAQLSGPNPFALRPWLNGKAELCDIIFMQVIQGKKYVGDTSHPLDAKLMREEEWS